MTAQPGSIKVSRISTGGRLSLSRFTVSALLLPLFGLPVLGAGIFLAFNLIRQLLFNKPFIRFYEPVLAGILVFSFFCIALVLFGILLLYIFLHSLVNRPSFYIEMDKLVFDPGILPWFTARRIEIPVGSVKEIRIDGVSDYDAGSAGLYNGLSLIDKDGNVYSLFRMLSTGEAEFIRDFLNTLIKG